MKKHRHHHQCRCQSSCQTGLALNQKRASKNPLRMDPTRTTALRNSFVREVNKRMAQLKRAIRYVVGDLDVFGIKRSNPFTANAPAFFFESYGIQTPRPSEIETILGIAYDPNFIADAGPIVAAQSPSAQLTAFQKWMKQQAEAGIIQVPTGFEGEPWCAPYIESSYKKAMLRTYTDIYGLSAQASGLGGSQAAFLQSAFAAPIATNQIQILATRCFQQLEGVTAAMEQQMARILADGLMHGRSPYVIARELEKTVVTMTKRRARTIARTEIIHAYAEGQLDTFEIVGKDDVTIMAEWSTAGDDRVCEACNSLEGVVLKVSEARGLIPRHPNCRCAFLPYDPMFPEKGSKTRKQEIEGAIRTSIKKTSPKGSSFAEAVESSSWAGSSLPFLRPK